MKAAILDLGTNVFNLLIARISKDKCEIEKIVKIPSFIGSGGFATGYLSNDAISSSMESLSEMIRIIDTSGGVDLTKAFATSAVRDAKNGSEFTKAIKERFGIEVETISGDREAELIYKGVRESVLLYDEKVLICDIGGGSVEMIIADKKKIYWKQSFDLGVVRLREVFKPSDPISPTQVDAVVKYLESSMKNLWDNCSLYMPVFMVGTSGSFDTLRELLYPDDSGELPAMNIDLDRLKELHNKLILSTRLERMEMPRMSMIRVDYMVLGSIFVQLVIDHCRISELSQSNFSLKEGYMAEIAESLNKQ